MRAAFGSVGNSLCPYVTASQTLSNLWGFLSHGEYQVSHSEQHVNRDYMRHLKIAIVLLVLAGIAGSVYAAAPLVGHGYTCTVTSVTSATVPTVIMTPGTMSDWVMHPEASPASDPVRVFPYIGAAPTAVPSPAAYMEIPSGSYLTDQITCTAPQCLFAMGDGWAAVLAGGSTATNFDACSR